MYISRNGVTVLCRVGNTHIQVGAILHDVHQPFIPCAGKYLLQSNSISGQRVVPIKIIQRYVAQILDIGKVIAAGSDRMLSFGLHKQLSGRFSVLLDFDISPHIFAYASRNPAKTLFFDALKDSIPILL